MSKRIKLVLNRPADRSYRAYREFVLSTAKALFNRDITDYDEKEMRARWKRFWAKQEAKGASD